MSVLWGGGWVGPQVNNFEQVSSDDHQMSVAVGPMSGIGGVPMSHMGNGHMGTPLPLNRMESTIMLCGSSQGERFSI